MPPRARCSACRAAAAPCRRGTASRSSEASAPRSGAPGASWFLLDIHAGGHGQLLEAVLPADLPHAPLLRGRHPHRVPRLLLRLLLRLRSHWSSSISAFSLGGASFIWVEEKGERNARSSGVHLVPVDVGEAEVQRAEGDGPPQLHKVPVVRLVLHDVAHAFVDDHLADYVGAQRSQDVGSVAQLPRLEVNLVEWVHGDPGKDLEGPVDVAAP